MQDRYAGDIGDFVKLGLLRAISPDHKLGVAWYRFPDEPHNKDGRHTGYLRQQHLYRQLDCELFDYLAELVNGERTIGSLLPMLPGAVSSGESLDMTSIPARLRRSWRQAWFSRTLEQLDGCDVVFADPDNGIVGNEDRRKGRAKFGKQMPLDEARSLAFGRCAIIYHHNTRRAGGHDFEVDYWLAQFGMPAIAVRATAYSPRTFFVINPDFEVKERVRAFCSKWQIMQVRLHVAAQ